MNKRFFAVDGAKVCCIVCEKEIVDANWFGRFKLGSGRVVVCRPYCMEKYLDDPDAYAAKAGLTWLAEPPPGR